MAAHNKDVLSIKAIKSSPEKIDLVTFHPVQPWVAYADRGGGVTVWNYESNEVVYANQLGGADEGALQEAILRQRANANAASLGGGTATPLTPAQELSLTAKSTASGAINDIKFFDLDTCFWQLAALQSQQRGAYDASDIPSLGGVRGLQGRRYIVAACESKVTLHDLCSSTSLDISRSLAFESKVSTRLAFLLCNAPSLSGSVPTPGATSASAPTLSPVLAVGVTSGAIYLVRPTSGAVYGKLAGAHRGAITSLLVLGSEEPGGPDRLISASADGTVALWDPSRTPRRGAEREIAHVRSFKAHEGGVLSAALFVGYAGEAPEGLPLRLMTTGADRKVSSWDVATWRKLGTVQPLPKAACHSVGFAPWGSAGLGVRPSIVLASGESTVLMGLKPATGQVTELINLMGMIDPGQKKAPKVYDIAVHPTRPHLMAAATNTGAVLLSGDPLERPAMVALPAQVLTLEALMHATGGKEEEGGAEGSPGAKEGQKEKAAAVRSKGAQGLTYVMASAGKLWSTAYRMESRVRSGASERSIALEAAPREAIADLDHHGRPVLACSSTGRSISLVWPDTRAYTILTLAPTGTWEAIDRGSGNCVAWASTAPMYAIISVPNIPVVEAKAKKGFFASLGGKKAAEEEQQQEADMEAVARAAAAATTVQVHVVDESNARQFVAAHDVNLGGAQPVLLHGGALLGIVAIDPTTLERSLRFFSWRDFSAVGPSVPEPTWVAWEPECTLCALAYEHTVELCRVHPTFHRFASLSLSHTQGGIWQSRQLYVSAPSSLHVIFADPAQEFVQEIALASFQGGVASKTAPPGDATPLPPEDMRPAGPVVLAGVRHSYLWLADGFARPFLVSLRHPGLRLRCLAARGELTTARTIAGKGLMPGFHDAVARFLAAMSPGDGVKEALLLPGLTPATEMALAIRVGAWDRAARCYQALALGVNDKALLALTAGRGADDGGDVADRLAGMSLGVLPSGATDHSAAVADILKQHEAAAAAPAAGGLEEEGQGAEAGANGGGANGHPGDDSQNGDAPAAGGESVWVEPVDWDAPLTLISGATSSDADTSAAAGGKLEGRSYGAGEDTSSGLAEVSAAASAIKVVDPGEMQRVHAAARLGLRFADAAIDAGSMDAARTALGVLVRFAPLLPARLLGDLVAAMGRCRMTESTRNLAAAAVVARPGSSLQDPEVASLLAALAGGVQGEAVHGTLQSSGLAPLSAVFAAVWGVGNSEAAMEKWKAQVAGRGYGEVEVSIVPPTM